MDHTLRNRKLNRSRKQQSQAKRFAQTRGYKKYYYRAKQIATDEFNKLREKVKGYRWNFWHSLNFEQKCYFLATTSIILVWIIGLSDDNALSYVPLLIAMTGLVSEIWPRFLRTWDNLVGRTVILLFYAIIANFALASAGGLVNDVTGVSADSLPYSHNIALILSLPTWFLFSSTLALLVIQLLSPIYLVILLGLRLIGLTGFWHPKNYRYVITTFITRFIWAMALLIYLFIAGAYSGFINHNTPIIGAAYEGMTEGNGDIGFSVDEAGNIGPINDSGKGNTKVKLGEADLSEAETELSAEIESELAAETKNKSTNTDITLLEARESDTEWGRKIVQKSQNVYNSQRSILAAFIYNYEADSRSRCEIPNGSKAIELNEFEILVVTPDESVTEAYTFSVIACESPGVSRFF